MGGLIWSKNYSKFDQLVISLIKEITQNATDVQIVWSKIQKFEAKKFLFLAVDTNPTECVLSTILKLISSERGYQQGRIWEEQVSFLLKNVPPVKGPKILKFK